MTPLSLGLQVMELVVKEKFILEERRISLSEFHTANEVSNCFSIESIFNNYFEISKLIAPLFYNDILNEVPLNYTKRP